jgi:menaquinone-9 beta-reductase
MTLTATLSLHEASQKCWDVVVVGAGPAGALAAHELARRRLAVLLVDRQAFPRWKVCGCCLNSQALAALRSAGLEELPERCRAVPLTAMNLATKRVSATIALSQGMALSRETLDAALVQAAIGAGANFLPETLAHVIVDRSHGAVDARSVSLTQQQANVVITCRLVIAADGLNGSVLGGETGRRATVAAHSRIGAGTIATPAETPDFFRRGTIYMACDSGGYVGLVRREDNALTIAAALDLEAIRRAGGVAVAAEQILHETDWPAIGDFTRLPWRGTPALTRQAKQPAAERILALGDAAGFVEPFTGEGMAWALTAAVAIPPIAERAVQKWHPALACQWISLHRRIVKQRQYFCHAAAWTLRSPWLMYGLVRALQWVPGLAVPFVRYVNSE